MIDNDETTQNGEQANLSAESGDDHDLRGQQPGSQNREEHPERVEPERRDAGQRHTGFGQEQTAVDRDEDQDTPAGPGPEYGSARVDDTGKGGTVSGVDHDTNTAR